MSETSDPSPPAEGKKRACPCPDISPDLSEALAMVPGLKSEVRLARISWMAVGGLVLFFVLVGGALLVRSQFVASDAHDAASRAGAAAEQAQRAIDQSNAEKQRNKVSTCNAQVDFATKHNGLVDEDEQTFKQIADAQDIGPDTRQFALNRIAAYELRKVVPRVCTPEAIEEFYANGGR